MSPAKKRSSAKKKKSAPTPQQFFGDAVPRLLGAMASLTQKMGGRYAIVVEGEGGGSWTLDFAGARVLEGEQSPDLSLHLDSERFGSLSSSKVELRKLVADGVVRCTGDVQRLESLSMVLAFMQRG